MRRRASSAPIPNPNPKPCALLTLRDQSLGRGRSSVSMRPIWLLAAAAACCIGAVEETTQASPKRAMARERAFSIVCRWGVCGPVGVGGVEGWGVSSNIWCCILPLPRDCFQHQARVKRSAFFLTPAQPSWREFLMCGDSDRPRRAPVWLPDDGRGLCTSKGHDLLWRRAVAARRARARGAELDGRAQNRTTENILGRAAEVERTRTWRAMAGSGRLDSSNRDAARPCGVPIDPIQATPVSI